MEYSSIRRYLIAVSKDFYLIKHHDTFFAYDYDHNLLDQFHKRFTNCLLISDYNQEVYITEFEKEHIYVWNVFNKTIKKVIYTEYNAFHIYNCIETAEDIKILYRGEVPTRDQDQGIDKYISHINKKTFKYKTELVSRCTDHYSPEKIYFIENQLVCSFSENGVYDKYRRFYVSVKNNDGWKEQIDTVCMDEPVFKVSQSQKYALLGSVPKRGYTSGEIKIFDLSSFQEIDTFQFYHVIVYRILVNFFEINNETYIVFQANPKPCTINNEIWYTYVYSLSQKKVIYEKKFSFALTYIQDIKLLIIEKNKARIESRFYKNFDESLGMDYIMNELVTRK
ncbi:MAG: hypothetical protein K2P09_08130 [Erysipelotrichales bacterium]|nr:hypothetical protein [Erysipelotrichales bacterium]